MAVNWDITSEAISVSGLNSVGIFIDAYSFQKFRMNRSFMPDDVNRSAFQNVFMEEFKKLDNV